MKYAIYDANGNLVNSGTTIPSQPGTGTGAPQVINLPVDFGHYWNTSYPANLKAPVSKALVNQNGNTLGSADAQWQATMSGTITSLAMYEAGPAAGDHSVEITINGNSQGTVLMGTGGNGKYFNQPVSYNYVTGDIIKANFVNTASGNTQVQLAFVIKYNS